MIGIIALILLGIVLVVLEIMLLPGLVAGIIGAVMMLIGMVLMYKQHGTVAGHITVVSSMALLIGALWWALRSKSWQRFSLKNVLDGKVVDNTQQPVKVGDEGVAVSALRPMGKARVGNNMYEVQSMGVWIDAGAAVRVIDVLPNKLLVEKM